MVYPLAYRSWQAWYESNIRLSDLESEHTSNYTTDLLYFSGGADRNRTCDPVLARHVLSQLSYSPIKNLVGVARLERAASWSQTTRSAKLNYTPMVGLAGLEPATSRLSGAHSYQLSYKPMAERKGFEPLRHLSMT